MTFIRRPAQLAPLDEGAQTLTEYSLLIGLIAIIVAVAIPAIATTITGFFTSFVAGF